MVSNSLQKKRRLLVPEDFNVLNEGITRPCEFKKKKKKAALTAVITNKNPLKQDMVD